MIARGTIGTVSRTDERGVYVQVGMHGDAELGPCLYLGPLPLPGERVLMMDTDVISEELVVLGVLRP